MRLMRYIESYSSLNYHTKTGVTNRPLFREGGNSTAFAVSLLEVAGLLFPEFEIKWRRDLFFPMRLVGGHPTGLRVELESLFTSPDAKRWSEYSHEHIPAVIWDPEKIDRWVTSIYQGSIFHPNLPVFTAQHRSAFGIIIDASLVSTPQGVFWNN
jgi:hypothetical protein